MVILIEAAQITPPVGFNLFVLQSITGKDILAVTKAAIPYFCVLMLLLVLMHKGKGGGLSDMFGGGIQSSVGGSSVAERNLDRITVMVGLAWAVCIIVLTLLLKFQD